MKSTESGKTTAEFSFITHMDTRHLRWAKVFASLIALCKKRDELLPSDFLAGLNVANFERLSRFWPRPEIFDDLVAEHCDWSEPRWLTFQRWERETRHSARMSRIPFGISFFTSRTKNRHLFSSQFKPSPDWKRLFETGEKLTTYKVSWQDRTLPLLTPEVMLLAFLQTENIPLAKCLRESGLMVDSLEEGATRHIDTPEKLMF